MANLGLNLSTPSGWSPWVYARSTYEGIQYLDASFPYLYTPSGGFWGRSIVSHCLIPWINTFGAFDTFMRAGGGTGSIMGSVSGLAAVANTFEISVHGETFAVGRNAVPPIMGYCLGNKFKQHVYTRMDVQNDGLGGTIVTNISVDLLQNYRFKRAYIHSGFVSSYTDSASVIVGSTPNYVLDLGISKSEPPPANINSVVAGTTISIVKAANASSASSTISVNVLGVQNNWDISISSPSKEISPGDYYELSTVWCIEDPYLLSGFWRGSENNVSISVPASGLDLYTTSHISPYEKSKFLGVYIWEKDTSVTTTTTTTAGGNPTATTTLPGLPYQPVTGYSMDDASGNTWAFLGFGNSNEYPPYPNDERYREIKLDITETDSSSGFVTFKPRLVSTDANYTYLRSTNPGYLRVEIGTGGYLYRHNWYAPCLKNQVLQCNGKKYQILNHITFNIIDVAFLDITGTTPFDPLTNQEYSIVNEYAWFINEHYDGRISTGNNTGIFKGTVTGVNSKKISVTTDGDTFISQYKKNGLSFIDRYEQDISITGMKKCFKKFTGWKMVSRNGKEYNIASVDFDSASNQISTPYPIIITLADVPDNISIRDRIYITFGESFQTFGNYSKESGYSFAVEAKAALQPPAQGFIVSNVLCLDGSFFTNPYKLDIESTDRIGFTEGYLFGLGANSSAESDYNQLMFMTVPRTGRGVASFFHWLRWEDWVAYEDAVTGKLTIRKGSVHFTDYPVKDMVSIGKPQIDVASTVSSPITLDTQYDFLRRMQVKVGSAVPPSDLGIMFGIGSPTNIYGFYISGDGLVNLNLLTLQGSAPGSVSSSNYSGEGFSVSPVFVYKLNYYQTYNNIIVNIGVKTEDGPIYINNSGDTEVVSLEYIKEKQTISDAGYFDIIRTAHGENLLIYGIPIGQFNLTSTNAVSGVTSVLLNNSGSNGTKWSNQNALMILGTYDDSYTWASPEIKQIDETNQYPLMLLNSVDYLACIYNPRNETLALFVRCSDSSSGQDRSYLGCYIVSIFNFQSKIFECTPITESKINFRWRPPCLPDSISNSASQSWTDSDNLINDNYSFDPSAEGALQDVFVRVMGSVATRSQVANAKEFGVISTAILPDGTYVVFYDSENGVKTLCSADNGISWGYSNVVFARQGRSAILLDRYLFYIGAEGIEFKRTQITDYQQIRNISHMPAGNSKVAAELELQSTLDAEQHALIGSGVIEIQRLSGYITPEGIIKVFFYDQKNLLKCMESKDTYKWNTANNF